MPLLANLLLFIFFGLLGRQFVECAFVVSGRAWIVFFCTPAVGDESGVWWWK